MAWLRWVVLGLAVAEAGYMALDGTVALTRGDYITPRSGPYAGRLGPWAGIVERLGIDPRSRGMKAFFVALGLAWLAVAVAFGLGAGWAWAAMLAFAIGSLWYLIVGTAFSVAMIALLLVPSVRAAYLG